MEEFNPHIYAQQISPDEYKRQAQVETEQQVKQLRQSDEYQRWINTCRTCGVCWYEGGVSPGCSECGGHPMTRPCPICSGMCNKIWNRDTDMSHSYSQAHWDGECALPIEQQQAHMLMALTGTSDSITEAMKDLSSSSND
ncbi:unnamed protein product [Owenia fusiformis]|uniref:Uncharacterized protein n=1 Tax=Owenia fusiformis TaxID=6347 RepID=A0A8J1URQ8_OWEFU|nr:unnamed protein product [Owenia fusiformis]